VTKKFSALILTGILTVAACAGKQEQIVGCWEVNFGDSGKLPRQYLFFTTENNRLHLLIDEPSDGMLGMPGENVSFVDGRLHYESLWGLWTYDGNFAAGNSLIEGVRTFNKQYATSFTMKRVSEKELTYRIPRIDAQGKRIDAYDYRKPPPGNDGIECSTLSEAGINPVPVEKLVQDVLKGEMATIHGLLIAKDDKLVLEEYFHDYDRDKLHSVESVTKSVTSALIGIAIDKKFIPGVHEPVWPYFKSWDSTRWVKEKYDVRIRHLLTMTAGLDWKGYTPNEANDDAIIYTKPDFIGYVLDKGLKEKPGDSFYYNNRVMLLLGRIVERSSGLSVDRFAEKYLFDELDIQRHEWKVYDNGVTETGGGLKMLPRDMLKFGLTYLNRGRWRNRQVVSSDWVASSTENHIHSGNQEYGYNWWIKSYSVHHKIFRTYYALGHGEQAIVVIPDAGVVFVMTAGNYFQARQRLDEIMIRYILPSISSADIPTPEFKPDHPVDFAGEYQTLSNERVTIELAGDSLIFDPRGKALKLIPVSLNYFAVENMPVEVHFIADGQGAISGVDVYVEGQRRDVFKKLK